MIDKNLDDYSNNLRKKVKECYEVAEEARSQGKDVSTEVEIPLANDMAERVEELIHIKGIANSIRELSKKMSREEVSLYVSKDVANLLKNDKREALDKSVRVGLAILTEGILVAPLEGIKEVNIIKNDDDTEYADIVYSGPIRSAGGTAQALSVLITDIVRRELDIGSFKATDEEVERYIEEVQAYNRSKHLQYLPTPDEIRTVIKNSPVMIDGEGSEEDEISGHRDMKRIKTNNIRGGMCLVLCEGLIQKARKVLKYTNIMNLKEWDILENIGKNKKEEKDNKSEKYLKDIIAGRPVFGYPNRPGGFRLRYGISDISYLHVPSLLMLISCFDLNIPFSSGSTVYIFDINFLTPFNSFISYTFSLVSAFSKASFRFILTLFFSSSLYVTDPHFSHIVNGVLFPQFLHCLEFNSISYSLLFFAALIIDLLLSP